MHAGVGSGSPANRERLRRRSMHETSPKEKTTPALAQVPQPGKCALEKCAALILSFHLDDSRNDPARPKSPKDQSRIFGPRLLAEKSRRYQQPTRQQHTPRRGRSQIRHVLPTRPGHQPFSFLRHGQDATSLRTRASGTAAEPRRASSYDGRITKETDLTTTATTNPRIKRGRLTRKNLTLL